MKYLITIISILFFSNLTIACEFFDKKLYKQLKQINGQEI